MGTEKETVASDTENERRMYNTLISRDMLQCFCLLSSCILCVIPSLSLSLSLSRSLALSALDFGPPSIVFGVD